MRINDENLLREMRKNTDKSQRVNSYKVKYLKMSGGYEELTFNQGYDHSTDIYNPFFVRVYDSTKSYVMGGSGPTIEDAYNSLVTQLIQYKSKAETERNDANAKLSKICGIVAPERDDDEDF